MKTRDVVIAALLIIILILLFRTKSFADAMAGPAPSPAPSSSPAPAALLVGALLAKDVSENCVQKYGESWAEVTPTLCSKIS